MIKTTVDKSGLLNLQTEIGKILIQLKELSAQKFVNTSEINKSIATVQKFQQVLDASFNTKLGMLDMSKLNTQLKESQISLGSLQKSFSVAGASGDQAFASVLGQLGKIDTGIKNTSSLMDKLANTMGNTIRWGIMSSAFNGVTDAMRQAVEYAKDLDDSLTQIMLVTDYSRDSMVDYAKQANEAAKSLGSTTTAMTNATLIFAQQGFDLNKSGQLAELSTKLANASQQDTAATSDQITAYMNAYGLDDNMEALSKALDSWANVANISAADVSELAQASQKAASSASTLGVTTDQLNAQIATIESVTREGPEQIGNGLKTIYARLSDLKIGKTLEDGVDLGTVTAKLEKIGVEVLDGDGKMRGVGSIMEDLMGVWSSIDSTQKAAVAQALAGKYQISRFEALMNRSDLYNEYKSGSENASGTLDVMNDKYIDSLQGRLTKLQATFEGIINDLGDSSEFYGLIDGLTSVLDLIDKLVDSIGGGSAALTAFGAIATKVFSKQMASGLNNMLQNFSVDKKRAENDKIRQRVLTEAGLQDVKGDKVSSITSLIDSSFKYQDIMNKQDAEDYETNLNNTVAAVQGLIAAEDDLAKKVEATNLAMADYVKTGEKAINLTRDENGALQAEGTTDYYEAMRNSDYQKALSDKDFKDKMHNIEKDANFIGIDVINGTTKALTALDEKGAAVGEAASNASTKVKDLSTYIRTFMSEIMGKDLTDTIFDELENKDYDELTSSMDKIIVKMRELLALSDDGNGEDFTAALTTDENKLKAIIALMNELQKQFGEVQTAANNAKNGNVMNELGDVAKGNNAVDQADRTLHEQEKKNGVQAEGLASKKDIQDIINMTSAVGDLAFAWQSFQSLGSIWENADLTEGEKLEQTILNLSVTIPMLVQGIEGLISGLPALSTGIIALANGCLQIAAGSTAATVSVTTLAGAFATLLPVIGILAAVGVAVWSIWDDMTKEQRALDEAKSSVQRFSEALQTARTESNNLNQSISSYKEAKSAIQDLKQGTDEWRDAISDSNDKVIELLNNYPKLAKYISRGNGGELTISESGLYELQKAQEKQIAFLEIAQQSAQSNAAKAQLEVDKKAVKEQIQTSINSAKVQSSLEKGSSISSMQNPYASPMSSENFQNNNSQISDEQFNAVLRLIREQGEQAVYDKQAVADALSLDVADPIVTAIIENADKIINYNTKSDENKAADRIRSEQSIQSMLNSQIGYDSNGEYNNQIVKYLSTHINKDSSEYKKEQEELDKLSFDDILTQYQDKTGDAYSEVDKEGNKAQFTPAGGGKSYTVTKDDMVDAIAMANALGDAAGSWEKIIEYISQINNSSLGQQYTGLSDSIMTGTKEDGFDFSSMSNDQLLKLTKEDITADSLGVSDEMAQAAGFKSAKAYAKAFKEQLQNEMQSQIDLKDLLNAGGDKTQLDDSNMFKDKNVSEISDAIAKNVKSIQDLDQAYGEGLLVQDDYLEGLSTLASEFPELSDQVTRAKKAQEKLRKAQKEGSATTDELRDMTMEAADAQADLRDALLTKKWAQARQQLESYNEALSAGEDDSESYQKALKTVAESLSNLSGAEVSTDWVEKNKAAVQDWLNGVEGAGAKLQALLSIDYADTGVKQTLAQMGVDYDNLRQAIETNQITFTMDGYADFDQVNAALHILQSNSSATSDELDTLAGYLQALGGASLVLEKDGKTMSIPAPPTMPKASGDDLSGAVAAGAKYAAELAAWQMQVSNALETGWQFKGIDLPDSKKPIPTSSPSGNTGKGKGGGGKGGGGKSYTPSKKDPIEDEIDRYERVETQLTAIGNDYDKLNKEQDRLTGTKLAENLAKQNELLQKQIKLYQEKMEIQKEEAKELQGKLSSGYGIAFDEEGFISNYKQVHQKLINDVNNLINQYNAATTESAQKALDDQIESAQKRLDKFKDLYKRYDTLVSDDLKDSIQQIEDLNDAIEDLNISIFQKQLDAADNIKDLHEMIFELNHALHSSIIDDNPFDNFEDHLAELGLYFNDTTMDVNKFYDNLAAKQKEILNDSKSTDAQKKAAQAQLEEIEKVRLEELNGSHTLNPLGTGYLDMALKDTSDISEQIRQFEETGSSEIFGKNSAEMYSVSKDILKKDIDLMTGLKDKAKEVHDDVMDMIDEISDAMDRRAAEYEAINDELEHQLNIIEMIHGDEAYAEMNKVLDVQSAAYKSQLDDLNKQKDIWQKMLDDIGERTEDNKEEWDEVHDKILDTTSQINDLVESSLETLQKKYSNTVSNLTKSWSSSMFGGADLDWMNTEWELINRNADYYLDSTNKAYNIQKLQSKYLDLLDGTTDLNIQRKITDQMGQQLGYLRDKTKLSEYDVQYANAQLEILQKQIALEEAQRNKSQMKLRRDTQGNYSYVYAANDDNVRSAQSDLLDAQNNAYNLSKEQMKQTQADSLSALQDAKSQVDDIWNNANISLEEKKKRTQTIIDSLKEYLAGTSEQLSTSEKNIIQDFIGMCDLLTDENKTGIEDIQNQIIQGNNDAFDQIDTRWATSFTGWLNNLQEFNTNTDKMFDDLVKSAEDFDSSVKDLSETSKTNFADISGSVKGVTDAYNKLNASQNEFLSNLTNMAGSVEKGEEALRKYKEEITSLNNDMSVLTKQMKDLTNKNEALERENRALRASAAEAANGGAGGSGGGANGGAGGSSGSASDQRLAKRIANSIWMYGDWGTGTTRSNNITKRFSRKIADLVQSYFNGSPAYGYQYRDYSLGFERFDTGGYTGSWYDGGLDSKDGKLALLHQKELILNATDTENILAAVEAVRAFTDNVKTSLLSNLSTAALSKYTATNSNPQDINQNVHITAEFPAANSASEIEEALMSLNDRAIQYAFKTK